MLGGISTILGSDWPADQYALCQRHSEIFQLLPLTCDGAGAAVLQSCHFLQFLFVQTVSVLVGKTGT